MDVKWMIQRLLFFLALAMFVACTTQSGQKRSPVSTQFVNADSISFSDYFSNPCDSFSLEVAGLYPVLDTLPVAVGDTLYLDSFLKQKGFEVVSTVFGNWEKGPRFFEMELAKDSCRCKVYKKYFYHQLRADSSYSLRVTERVVCNTALALDN